MKRTKINKARLHLTLLAIPFLVYIIAFCYIPLFGWGLAFTNYRPGMAFAKLDFVGFKYFLLIGTYWERILRSLRNTLVLSMAGFLVLPLPMLFAILLNELKNLFEKKLIQTLVTLTNFVSWVIVYSICFGLFSSNGVLDTVLNKLGLISAPTQLMANGNIAWTFMILLGVWKSLGWSAIIYLAAISGIDNSLYEAAHADGANRFHCMRYITLPELVPTFMVLLILQIGNMLSVGFEQYLLFSNSMTSSKLEVLDVLTYNIGLMSQDYSFATAISILRSIVSVVLIMTANRIAKKVRGESII